MAILIDSGIFVEFERRQLSLDVLLRVTGDNDAALSSMTASELLTGVHRADSATRRQQREAYVEGILNLIPAVPFDLAVARVHARLWADLTMSGKPIDVQDSIIAATALTHGYSVLTDNLRDFERVPGLVVRRPAWPQ